MALDLRVRLAEHIVYRDFGDQSVVLNLQAGQYHGLNGTAGAMLALLLSGETIASVASSVTERYRVAPADAERDVRALCASLLERGIVQPAELRPG